MGMAEKIFELEPIFSADQGVHGGIPHQFQEMQPTDDKIAQAAAAASFEAAI